MGKTRSKEEKLKLIEDFKASGLSINKWCSKNNVATSTMSTWLGAKKKNKVNGSKTMEFVEVPKLNKSENSRNHIITIEYKEFKISIRDSLDINTFSDIMKVVTGIDV